MRKKSSGLGGFFGFLIVLMLLIALVVAIPIAGIWSLNTLFPALAIDYTMSTWFAMFFLMGSVGGAARCSKS